jgi:predicted O-methyltransferase YrrM
LIIADNVVRGGDLADPTIDDPGAQAQRRLHAQVARDSRLTATTIQTVGAKGYDGMLIARLD